MQTAFCRKFETYANILPELRRQGIVFKPLVWSTEGAPHPIVLRIMGASVRKQFVAIVTLIKVRRR